MNSKPCLHCSPLHHYPFGLTMVGISTKAAGKMENAENTFQSQKFDDDLGVNWVQFKWRNHDPQVGRFVQIDPLSTKYVYNSTYAFSENKVISHVELEGLEAVLFINKSKVEQKINQALNKNDIDEAKRIIWVGVSKGDISFTKDVNQMPGYNVFGKDGKGILGENDRERVLYEPKDPWVKGGVDETEINDLRSDLAEVTNNLQATNSKINEMDEMITNLWQTSSDPSDPAVGHALGKFGANYMYGTFKEYLQKRTEKLEPLKNYLEEQLELLLHKQEEAQKKSNGKITY